MKTRLERKNLTLEIALKRVDKIRGLSFAWNFGVAGDAFAPLAAKISVGKARPVKT